MFARDFWHATPSSEKTRKHDGINKLSTQLSLVALISPFGPPRQSSVAVPQFLKVPFLNEDYMEQSTKKTAPCTTPSPVMVVAAEHHHLRSGRELEDVGAHGRQKDAQISNRLMPPTLAESARESSSPSRIQLPNTNTNTNTNTNRYANGPLLVLANESCGGEECPVPTTSQEEAVIVSSLDVKKLTIPIQERTLTTSRFTTMNSPRTALSSHPSYSHSPRPTARPGLSHRRSRAIAIKRRGADTKNSYSNNSQQDLAHSAAAEAESNNELMYDYATWRMYNRIIDHRRNQQFVHHVSSPQSTNHLAQAAYPAGMMNLPASGSSADYLDEEGIFEMDI